MAETNHSDDSSPVDFKKHAADYSLLISMLKWGGIIAILLGFLVMFLLAN